MPWTNQKDDKGESRSPWGRQNDKNGSGNAPRGSSSQNGDSGGRGNPPVPDIDALLRKGQNQIKNMGGGFIAWVIIILAVIFWLFHCFYVVEQNEQAVELRLGKPKQTVAEDGLHFYLWPIENYRKVPRTEQTVTIGGDDGDGLMLSGDQNIVKVNFSVYYYITKPASYLFNVRDQSGTIRQVAESAMREVVGRRPADDVYRNRREIVANEVRNIIQSTLDKYGLGVNVSRVSIREAAPPAEVADAFNAVQQAEQERNRAIEQGNQERARLRGLANGQASIVREKANAYKARIVEEARGEAQRFITVEKEAKTAPEATRFRLYLEAMEQMLSAPNKLVIGAGNNIVPYLPLDKFMGGSGAAQPVSHSRNAARSDERANASDNSPMRAPEVQILDMRGSRLSAINSGKVR